MMPPKVQYIYNRAYLLKFVCLNADSKNEKKMGAVLMQIPKMKRKWEQRDDQGEPSSQNK